MIFEGDSIILFIFSVSCYDYDSTYLNHLFRKFALCYWLFLARLMIISADLPVWFTIS